MALWCWPNGYLYDDSTGESTPVVHPPELQRSPAVVLGDGQIIAFGGYRVVPGQEDQVWVQQVTPTNEAWVLTLRNHA